MDTLVDLAELLAYDPDTGAFTWKVDRPPRGKAGQPAGSMRSIRFRDRDNEWRRKETGLVISIKGQKFLAARIAWLFAYGKWPDHTLAPVDGDVGNLAIGNLALQIPEPSGTRQAIYARMRRRATQRARAEKAAEGEYSMCTGVVYRPGSVHSPLDWVATASNLRDNPDRRNFVSGRFRTRHEAEEFITAREAALVYVDRHPVQPTMPGDLTTYAGPSSSLSLAELRQMLCYDPDTGVFYDRAPDYNRGRRADQPNPHGGRAITLEQRPRQTHMVAWFITHGVWPKRKSVLHRNDDLDDNRLDNLELRP